MDAATHAVFPYLISSSREARTYREHAQALWVTSMSDAPVTLGHAAKASLHLIVWCKTCRHQNKTDPADVAALYGPDTPLETWRERLVCSQCGSRDVEILVMGRVARAIDDAPSCASGICLCSAVRSAAAAAVARARNAGVQAALTRLIRRRDFGNGDREVIAAIPKPVPVRICISAPHRAGTAAGSGLT